MAELVAAGGFLVVALVGIERWWECRFDDEDADEVIDTRELTDTRH